MALVCLFAAKSALPDVVKFSKRFNSDVAMDWLPVNMLFCAMLMTGFLSLKALAVPMVTIFKNLTNVVILTGDWYFHGASISRGCDDAVHTCMPLNPPLSTTLERARVYAVAIGCMFWT